MTCHDRPPSVPVMDYYSIVVSHVNIVQRVTMLYYVGMKDKEQNHYMFNTDEKLFSEYFPPLGESAAAESLDINLILTFSFSFFLFKKLHYQNLSARIKYTQLFGGGKQAAIALE